MEIFTKVRNSCSRAEILSAALGEGEIHVFITVIYSVLQGLLRAKLICNPVFSHNCRVISQGRWMGGMDGALPGRLSLLHLPCRTFPIPSTTLQFISFGIFQAHKAVNVSFSHPAQPAH